MMFLNLFDIASVQGVCKAAFVAPLSASFYNDLIERDAAEMATRGLRAPSADTKRSERSSLEDARLEYHRMFCDDLMAIRRLRVVHRNLQMTREAREEALGASMAELNATLRSDSKLGHGYIEGTITDVSAKHAAAILVGVSNLFSIGGHIAFSNYNTSLKAAIFNNTILLRQTYATAMQEYIERNRSRIVSAVSLILDDYDSDSFGGRDCHGRRWWGRRRSRWW
mmetsp:Transcript_34700/g.97843  ORF Transcript_34700/g.97843 Transcript_34700/m.97843 type:complete len:225 (-) Transcript_34700:34-708(-)